VVGHGNLEVVDHDADRAQPLDQLAAVADRDDLVVGAVGHEHRGHVRPDVVGDRELGVAAAAVLLEHGLRMAYIKLMLTVLL